MHRLNVHDYPQLITSARTCRRITAAGARVITTILPSGRVLDFGGGRWSDAQEFLLAAGIHCNVYDPYNRSQAENKVALEARYDAMMCCNVLNVLTNNVLPRAIEDMATICEHSKIGVVVVTVYERNKTGHGEMSGIDEYQRNERLKDYAPRLGLYFRNIRKVGKALVMNPKGSP